MKFLNVYLTVPFLALGCANIGAAAEKSAPATASAQPRIGWWCSTVLPIAEVLQQRLGDAGWDHLASHSKMVPELANQELSAGEIVTVVERACVDYQRVYPRPKEHEISRRDRLRLLRVILADAPVVMQVIDKAQTYTYGDDETGGERK